MSGDVWVRVHFREPVEGPDPYARARTVDDRHEFRCEWLRQDDDEILFGVFDEIVERWPRGLVTGVEWRVPEDSQLIGRPSRGPTIAERRASEQSPRLGERWGAEEEGQLRQEFQAGVDIREIATRHGRNVGGIRSRLVRLGLLTDAGADVVDSPGYAPSP